MKKEATATGRTVEDAIQAACDELNLPREEVEVEVLDLPRKGFFGFSHTPAKVRVWVERCADKMQIAADYVTAVVHAMGLPEAQIHAVRQEQNIQLGIEGDVSGLAIGRRGETLDALQYLAGVAANRVEGEYTRVFLDSGNYREKRKATLEQLARKLGNNAIKTGRSTTLEPMNPYERRIIHSAVSEMEGVASLSVGEEPNRCVVISSTAAGAARPQGERAASKNARSGDRRGGGRGPRYGNTAAAPASAETGNKSPSGKTTL